MLALTILILLIAKAYYPKSLLQTFSPIFFTRIVAIAFLYSGLLSLNTYYIESIGSGIGIYNGLFQVTSSSQFIEIFFYFFSVIILSCWPLMKKNIFYKHISIFNIIIKNKFNNYYHQMMSFFFNKHSSDYSLIILFTSLGSVLLISSSDLISMYLSLELQSFGLYILSTLYKESESSTSAGLKYFLLGGLSSCFILLGISLVYSYTGLTNFESIYSLISLSDYNNISQYQLIGGNELIGDSIINNNLIENYINEKGGILLGLIIILIGFLFKIAAAPLHNWAPDVYDETPTIVTIWLITMPKLSLLILMLELQTQIDILGGIFSFIYNNFENIDFMNSINSITSYPLISNNINEFNSINNNYITNYTTPIKNLFFVSSLISLIIGTVVGLAQTKIKRLLTYSTISHIGFMLLALAINSEKSIDSFLFYIIQYTITNLNIFLVLISLSYIIKKYNYYKEFETSLDYYNEWIIKNKDNQNSKQSNNLTIFNTKEVPKLFVEKDIKKISDLTGQFFFNPLIALSLTISILSLAGIPPFIGFFAKLLVLLSALQSDNIFFSILGILVSVISATYYLKIIRFLITNNNNYNNLNETNINYQLNENKINFNYNTEINNNNNLNIAIKKNIKNEYEESGTLLTDLHVFLISTLTMIILLFLFKPSILLRSTGVLSLTIFNS